MSPACGHRRGLQTQLTALVPNSLQEKNPEQDPIPLVLRETIAYLQAHGECQGRWPQDLKDLPLPLQP